jgi:Ni/Co efflux regulator RcnB
MNIKKIILCSVLSVAMLAGHMIVAQSLQPSQQKQSIKKSTKKGQHKVSQRKKHATVKKSTKKEQRKPVAKKQQRKGERVPRKTTSRGLLHKNRKGQKQAPRMAPVVIPVVPVVPTVPEVPVTPIQVVPVVPVINTPIANMPVVPTIIPVPVVIPVEQVVNAPIIHSVLIEDQKMDLSIKMILDREKKGENVMAEKKLLNNEIEKRGQALLAQIRKDPEIMQIDKRYVLMGPSDPRRGQQDKEYFARIKQLPVASQWAQLVHWEQSLNSEELTDPFA